LLRGLRPDPNARCATSHALAAAVALRATDINRAGRRPADAWAEAAAEVFPDSPSSQVKGCPMGAFLGLCEEGRVAGVPVGGYTASRLNKQYALDAVRLLVAEPGIADLGPEELWRRVMDGRGKRANSQMEVVLGLWRAGRIAS
jgi:hypothetical protein